MVQFHSFPVDVSLAAAMQDAPDRHFAEAPRALKHAPAQLTHIVAPKIRPRVSVFGALDVAAPIDKASIGGSFAVKQLRSASFHVRLPVG